MARIALTSALIAAALTVSTYAVESGNGGGYRAQSAPAALFVLWFVIVVAARWLRRNIHRR